MVCNKSTPTGKRLWILNLSAQANLTNGFRYTEELLIQHRSFYLNTGWKLLEDNKIPVYTVKTDAFTIKKSQLEEVQELLFLGGRGRHLAAQQG